MARHISRITARGQATIPWQIRESANLRAGDVVAFEFENGCVLMRKIVPGDELIRGLAGTLVEWSSPEDEAAWRDL